MTVTTEAEILDRIRREMKSCINDCHLMARVPAKGPAFVRMRASLKAIENCCRQMCAWREDTRWLPMGMAMEFVHQRSREWVAGEFVDENGVVSRRKASPWLFLKLAVQMVDIQSAIEVLATAATGHIGMILPAPLPAPHRETRPVQVLGPVPVAPRSSIILPHEVQ